MIQLAQIFVEKVNSELKYINESSNVSGKTYIGKLAGIAADFTKPTRNGRRYPLELWENVEKSDDFKEMMETMTCFGEADHPSDESGRVDTSIKEIAVVLTKYEIRKSEGVVYCEFLILDTPNGRIIKTLLDAGCKMGVSSRGIGDEVVRNGETIIDPNTYQFYGFDVVVMPAVVSARPAVVESKNSKQRSNIKLVKSIRKEILNANTEQELTNISNMIDASKLPDVGSLKESINIRLGELKHRYRNNIPCQESANTVNSDEENHRLRMEIEKLKFENKSLQSKLSADNIRLSKLSRNQISNTDTICEKLRKENIALKRQVESKNNKIASLQFEKRKLRVNNISVDDNSVELNECKRKLAVAEKKISKLLESQSYASEMNNHIQSLEQDLNVANDRVKKLQSTNSLLEGRIKSLKKSYNSKKVLSESKQKTQMQTIQKQLNEAKTIADNTLNEYIKYRCLQENLDEDTVKQLVTNVTDLNEVDKIIFELSDRKRRLDKVPIAFQPRTARLVESSGIMSKEDMQTMAFLKQSINNQ